MSKITFTNSRGKYITISDDNPFLLVDFSSNVDNEIYTTKSPKQDGATYRDSNLDKREIDIEFVLTETTREGLIRNKLLVNEVFNPKLGKGILKYEDEGITRAIKCYVDALPFFRDEGMVNSRCLISILALDPYWRDNVKTSEEMVSWIGGFSFPLQLPTQFSMAGEKKVNIYNGGDVETPVLLEIQGPALNPKVTNTTTGEFIRVKRDLKRHETLTISTEFGNKTVKRDGESVFNFIDIESVFFNLEVGDNVIELTTDREADDATVKITYTRKYIGV